MTPFIVLCMIGAAIKSVLHWLNSANIGSAPDSVKLHCRNSMTVRLDLYRTGSLARSVFGGLGWRIVTERPSLLRFSRGDETIRRLPCRHDVAWRDLPVILSLCLKAERDGSRIDAEYVTLPLESCDQDCFDQFLRLARQEFDEAIESMDVEARHFRERGGPKVQEQERVGGYQKASERAAALIQDFKTLGLTIHASWDEIRTAYHDSCLKYHPDRLTASPKHLVDLAVTQFKNITDAYKRLKDHFKA